MQPLARKTHPIVFLFLIAPYGVMAGYLSVTVAYLLTRAGVGIAEVATLIALSYLPHTWKFLWAPIADTTLNRKTWYLLAALASALGIYLTGALPATQASMPLLTVIVLVSNLASTFLGMAVESLMAHATPDEEKGRAGGWFQAGNLGGGGIGGGLGLWLAERSPAAWMPGAMLAALCLLCCIALFFVAEPKAVRQAQNLWRNLAEVARDLWSVARSRMGYLGLLICFLPIGSGAASNLWSSLAGDWHTSADTVAGVNGVMNGLVSAVGCVIGGYLCDRMDRKHAYALFGVLLALCACGMAFAPRTPAMYVVFVLLYAFVTGLCFASFSAVVLEAIGRGAAATKYSLFGSLSNMPIAYMTAFNGWAYARWGTSTMLYLEAAIGVAGVLLFAGVAMLSHRMQAQTTGIA
jgi:MFS transporter, PAT family, beta-lactamase induction signal transducer AmpG